MRVGAVTSARTALPDTRINADWFGGYTEGA